MKMRATRTIVFGMATLAAAALPLAGALLSAQTPTAQAPPVAPTAAAAKANAGYGHLNFVTNVGAFKVLGSDEVPVTGALTLKFTGTVLVSVPKPGTKITVTGNVRKEYETQDKLKQVYFGTGTMQIVGVVRAVQFFGRDLTGHFDGVGIFRFYGEFDKKLETGTYWFDGAAPEEKRDWGTGGGNVVVPDPQRPTNRPRVRVNKTGG